MSRAAVALAATSLLLVTDCNHQPAVSSAGPLATYGWPTAGIPSPRLTRAVGATILPLSQTWHRQGYELFLGYRMQGTSYAVRRSVRITYRVQGVTYRQTIPTQVAVCPSADSTRNCLDRAVAEAEGPPGER